VIVSRPKLSFWEKSYLPQIFSGLWLTLKHIPQKKVTLQYPEQRPKLLGKYRGAPTLVKNPFNEVKCVSCQLCEFICPPKAIRITPGHRNPASTDANVEKEPQEFVIDMLRCIYCGLCEEVCPEEAIILQKHYALTAYQRSDLSLPKQKLLEMGGIHNDTIRKWKTK